MALADGRTPAILGGQQTQARAIASQLEPTEIPADTLYGLALRILNSASNLNGCGYDLRIKFDDRPAPAVVDRSNTKKEVERRPTVLEVLNMADQHLLELHSHLQRIESAVGNW